MQTTVEEAAKHRVRLSVEISPEEFASDLDKAYRRVGAEIKVPGFRKGKVPRKVIDARLGREHVLHEFVEEFLPAYYYRAVREHELAPIGDPEIDLDQLEDGRPLKFTATVEVRPRLDLEPESYRGIRVPAPVVEPTEREVDQYVDRLRERFAELEVVSRPARPGDYVLADVRASVHGTEVTEATRLGFLWEVGSDELVPELDREVEGKRKGEILKFNARLPEGFGERAGEEVTFQVLLKEVKSKKLPAADDEFARTASEFDTLSELREDIRAKLRQLKEAESETVVRDLVLHRLVDTALVELPDRLVDEETQRRVEAARRRAEEAGTTLDAVLAEQGWDELRLRSDARAHAIRAIKADLVLEAVARREGIQITREELQREIRALAESTGREPREIERMLQRTGQVASLAGDIIRSKALDFLVEAAQVDTEDASAPSAEAPTNPEDRHG